MKGCWIMSEAFSASNKPIISLFVLQFVDMMGYIIDLHILNHCSISGIKPTLSWWVVFLIYSWIQFASILVRNFASVFIREITLYFSFFFETLPGLGIKITVASYNELGNVLSVSILWNNLRNIDANYSLKVWQNLCGKSIWSCILFWLVGWLVLLLGGEGDQETFND